jgi:GTPase SAR1 family protein
MFCCVDRNDEAAKVDKKISKDIQSEQRNNTRNRMVKLLLLGAGDSGKSTLAKQMKIIYLDGYTVEERKNIIPAIHQNILSTFKDMLKGLQTLKLKLPNEVQEYADYIATLPTHEKVTPQLAEKIKALAHTADMVRVIKKSIELQIYDHFEYMMNKIDEIADADYVPTVDDILRTRVRTTGINEITYEHQNMSFTVVDMGGQRSERRKWIFFFEGVTAVIFVLAMNEFDMKLREDPTMNRMQESLNLFKNVINNQFLKDTAVILFLNKIDLFKEKISDPDKFPLSKCFPDYQGEQNYDTAMSFISTKFKSFDMNTKRTIFIHPTCATDTKQMEMVLADVKLTLIQKVLQDIGILM